MRIFSHLVIEIYPLYLSLIYKHFSFEIYFFLLGFFYLFLPDIDFYYPSYILRFIGDYHSHIIVAHKIYFYNIFRSYFYLRLIE